MCEAFSHFNISLHTQTENDLIYSIKEYLCRYGLLYDGAKRASDSVIGRALAHKTNHNNLEPENILQGRTIFCESAVQASMRGVKGIIYFVTLQSEARDPPAAAQS